MSGPNRRPGGPGPGGPILWDPVDWHAFDRAAPAPAAPVAPAAISAAEIFARGVVVRDGPGLGEASASGRRPGVGAIVAGIVSSVVRTALVMVGR